jgi:acyl-CoA reductase-like NAD-dependent aldehyde dehydrogenase
METIWGLNTPGAQRGELMLKLADLIDKNKEELAALEALDNGKQPRSLSRQGLTDACREGVYDSPSFGHPYVC